MKEWLKPFEAEDAGIKAPTGEGRAGEFVGVFFLEEAKLFGADGLRGVVNS